MKPYSEDLRSRVVAAVDRGMSRRRAAAMFAVGVSTVIGWMRRVRTTGSVAALPMGGDRRSKLTGERDWLLERLAAQPDMTLAEMRAALAAERGVQASYGAVWRFFAGEGISFKKNRARRRAGPAGRRDGARGMAAQSGRA